MNGWEGIPQASAQGNERKRSAKPTAVNEAGPAYEVRFAERKPCKAGERPLCMIEIPCPRTDTLLTHRARGCRGDAKPPAFFNANFSDDSDNSDDSDPAPPGCAVASNALYKGRHERSGELFCFAGLSQISIPFIPDKTLLCYCISIIRMYIDLCSTLKYKKEIFHGRHERLFQSPDRQICQ